MTVNDQDPYSQEPLDSDPDETSEWQESLQQLVQAKGHGRGREIMLSLLQTSHELQLNVPAGARPRTTSTRSRPRTSPSSPATRSSSAATAGGSAGTPRSRSTARSAPASASAATSRRTPRRPRSTKSASTTSSAGLDDPNGGDQIFIQGHASPGIYARSFLEGRLTSEQLDGFRQEKSKAPNGIPSYPHPRLMPEYWQFPTVSMGLGPINAIYQAMTNKYLTNRGIKDVSRLARVGVPRRRRDGRGREPRSAAGRRERGPRQPRPSSSTATCSASTARCAATARSSRSSRASSAAPAGTSSRSSGAAAGTSCWRRTPTARSCTS